MTDDLIERVARAWASIDGKAETFDREKAIVYPNWEGDSGTYEGYMTEAEELLKRSGLAALLATSAEKDAEIAKWEELHEHNRDLQFELAEKLGDARDEARKAKARAEAAEAEAAALREDAARYRWLRDNTVHRSNRWPHVTQYPYAPEIDDFAVPQIQRNGEMKGQYLDEAIDAGRAAPPERLLNRHARALQNKEQANG